MKKIICLILSVLLITVLFAACGDGDSSSTDSIPVADSISFTLNDEANYVIVRAADSGDTFTALGTKIFKALKATFDKNFKSIMDDNEEVDCEILIGDTNRAASKKAKEIFLEKEARHTDFLVCAIGTKLCIYASSEEGYNKATDWFIENLLKSNDVDPAMLYAELEDGSQYKTYSIAGNKVFLYSIVRPRYECGYLEQNELTVLQDTVLKDTGYYLPIVKDNTAAADYEIVMGKCERDGVKSITQYDEYDITVSGNKVYINGGSTESRVAGIKKFISTLTSTSKFDANASGTYSAESKSYAASEYKYVWGDDFDSPTLDTSLWNLGAWQIADINQANTPQTFYIADSVAYMTSYKNADDPKYYTPAFLQTDKTMGFTYGYLEIKAVPCLSHGNSTAFWSTTDTANMQNRGVGTAEIDFVEVLGYSTKVVSNLHKWSRPYPEATHTSIQDHDSNRTYQFDSTTEEINTQFHIFGFEWTKEKMRFSVDGEVYFEPSITKEDDYDPEKDNEMFHEPLSLLICEYLYTPARTELGSARLNGDEEFAYQTQVDYVKLYQNDIGKLYKR